MEELSVLIEKSQAGDKETRSILIENNLGLVHHIVKRFAGRGYETEDLFQIGVIGLMKAIDKFDLTYDVKFSTYAVPMILGEIKRFLRDDGMIKVSRTIKENGLKVRVVSENLIKKLGRDTEKEALLNHLMLKQVLEALDEKEKKLIEMRYFQDKTQSEVAACMGISQVQVSRLEKKILFKMRGFLNFL